MMRITGTTKQIKAFEHVLSEKKIYHRYCEECYNHDAEKTTTVQYYDDDIIDELIEMTIDFKHNLFMIEFHSSDDYDCFEYTEEDAADFIFDCHLCADEAISEALARYRSELEAIERGEQCHTTCH